MSKPEIKENLNATEKNCGLKNINLNQILAIKTLEIRI